MEATIFLGAGFSRIAGLPLTSELFKSDIYAPSPSALSRIEKVLGTWEKWHKENPEENAEQFIGHIFDLSKSSSSPIPWKWVVEVIAASIATPRGPDAGSYNRRYAGRITSPIKCREHQLFWKIVNKVHIRGVISTNYDIVIERGLTRRRQHPLPARWRRPSAADAARRPGHQGRDRRGDAVRLARPRLHLPGKPARVRSLFRTGATRHGRTGASVAGICRTYAQGPCQAR